MGLKQAYNSLRWKLAFNSSLEDSTRGITKKDWKYADKRIDQMTNTELLEALADEEDE